MIYYIFLMFIMWGLFHGLMSGISLFLGQSFYIEAFCEDLRYQLSRLGSASGQFLKQKALLADIVQLNVETIQ